MIGIYDCFGYDVSFSERYKLIKDAGFDSVMLWWSDKFGRGTGYQEDVKYARNAGLLIENIHAPVHEQNFLSLDNQDGESVFQNYLQCVKDCFKYDVSTMVIHLPGDKYPINELGIERINTIIFYDSCHHVNYAADYDLLEIYGERLMAIHLQDNGGRNNQHQLPFDGTIDWETVMKKISRTDYHGATSLEPMNWEYEDISIQEFLDRACIAATKLNDMRMMYLYA